MITKKTFITIVNALDFDSCKCRQFCEVNNLSLEETNEFIHGGNLQNDLLKMLETVMLDRYGIIRDFLYKRDENGELFFGIPQRNGVIEIYLITSAEELYEYLLEQAAEQPKKITAAILQQTASVQFPFLFRSFLLPARFRRATGRCLSPAQDQVLLRP